MFSITAAVFSDQDLSVLFHEYLSGGYELNRSGYMFFLLSKKIELGGRETEISHRPSLSLHDCSNNLGLKYG